MKLSKGKWLLLLLSAATFLDSLFVRKGASPGHAGAFFLAWAISTRLFLADPSINLVLFSLLLAAACIASDRGILTNALLCSPYFYFACGLLVVYWEKFVSYPKLLGRSNGDFS